MLAPPFPLKKITLVHHSKLGNCVPQTQANVQEGNQRVKENTQKASVGNELMN